MDMLRTRHRERILLAALIEAKQPFVVDNTNPSTDERSRYLAPARKAHFRTVGFYFESRVELSRQRDQERPKPIGDKGIRSTAARLQRPTLEEGFDDLFYVRLTDEGFEVSPWQE